MTNMTIHDRNKSQCNSRLYHTLVLTWLLQLLLVANNTDAQALVITDCQGITRAVHQTQPSQLNQVSVDVNDSATGAPNSGTQVQLTNNITGEVYTTQTQAGAATFGSVPPGNYSLVISGTNSVGAITIGSSGLGLIAASAVVAGGAVAGGGVAAGGVLAADEIHKQITNNSQTSPTPTPTIEAVATPTSSAPPVPPTATPTPTLTPCDCTPDAEPTPLDNFFDDPEKAPLKSRAALSPYR